MLSGSDLVARNVRRFRLERGLSIGEVARRSGLSKQTVSKVELGEGNPTVDTLMALGEALDISARRLLTEWDTPVFVQRGTDAEWASGKGYAERHMDQVYGSGYVRTQLLRLERGGGSGELDSLPPGTLHHVYVVSGKVTLGPLADAVEAASGDFVRFPGDTPHRFACRSETALLHLVTTLPQMRQVSPEVLEHG